MIARRTATSPGPERRQPSDARDAGLHAQTRGRIGRMNSDQRRLETASRHRFLDPHDNVVTCAARIVAEVVVEAYLGDLARLQQRDGFVGPVNSNPPRRGVATIVEEYFHVVAFRARCWTAAFSRSG